MTRIAVAGIDDYLRPPEERYARALVRDPTRMPDVRVRYEQRYFPGQHLYLAEVDPKGRAEIVVDA